MAKPITVIYPMFNRLEYTKLTFPKMLHEAIRSHNLIEQIRVYDDNSMDGSSDFVKTIIERLEMEGKLPFEVLHIRKSIGNSTYQTNDTYKHTNSKYLVKIDNDIIIPTGYYETLNWLMDKHESIGFLMLPEVADFPFIKDKKDLSLHDRTHIGGVGAFRRSIFVKQGDINSDKKFFGFTAYQNKAKNDLGVRTCELRGSGNTNLDASPVYSRVKYYEQMGWGRNMWKGVHSLLDNK
jgi:glycosyltransferase involved in cell wall biosynthesis